MATVTKGKTFINGDLVTPAALHQLVDSASVTNIANADLASDAAIADTKLATIATAGKVANSATTATPLLQANTIVRRDAAGNFDANIIGANITGTASNVTGTVAVANGGTGGTTAAAARTGLGLGNSATLNTGTGSGTVAAGDHTHAQLHDRSHAITSTSDHTAGNWKVFHSDGTGQVVELPLGTAGQVLTANGTTTAPTWQTLAATTTSANNLTGGVAGSIPYQSAAGATAMLSAGTSGQVLRSNGSSAPSWDSFGTSGNTANAVVQRDGFGNFSAGTITANLTGTASGNAPSSGISPSAITGTAVITTDSRLSDARNPTSHNHDAAAITTGTIANARTTATNTNTASAIVARDGSGNFSAGTITASLSGNATTATTATSATTSSNLAAGSAGALPYQSGAGTTAMLSAGTSGAYLKSNGTAAPSWASVLEPKAFALVKFTDSAGAFTTLRSQGVTITRGGTGIYNFAFSPALPQVPLISSTGGREDHIWLDLTTTSATLNTRVYSGSGTYAMDDPLINYGQHHISFIFF
jgi:hypothetical protein